MRLLRALLLLILKAWIGRRVIATIGPQLPPAPFIVTANHTSYFDHFVIGWWLLCHGRPYPRFLSKSELFERPLSAWFNRLGGGIPVVRGGVDTAAFDKAAEVLSNGGVFIMYAEGTRSRDGWLHAPRRGVAALAAQTGVPVVPVGLLGVNDVLPVGGRWPKRRRRIIIHSGSSLNAPPPGKLSEQAFIRSTFQSIAALTGQWPAFLAEPDFAPTTTLGPTTGPGAKARDLVEEAFLTRGPSAEPAFRQAVAVTRGSRDAYAVLERGRALGQLALLARNPFRQLFYALLSRRIIWQSVRRLPAYAPAWHVWASMLEQLPGWLGGDSAAARTGHRVAVSLDPRTPRYLLHAATSYRSIGRDGEAERWLQRLLAMDDSGPHGARALVLWREWNQPQIDRRQNHESSLISGASESFGKAMEGRGRS
ncbi:1-acyl-sn-glycerol-3-phosphate acyltransferase [Arthrobacter sp. 2762]